jgi:hypothetical protein
MQSVCDAAPRLQIDYAFLCKWCVMPFSHEYLNDHYYFTITLDSADYRILSFASHIRRHHNYYHLSGLSFIDLASDQKVDFRVDLKEVLEAHAKGETHFGPGAGVALNIKKFLLFASVYYKNMNAFSQPHSLLLRGK